MCHTPPPPLLRRTLFTRGVALRCIMPLNCTIVSVEVCGSLLKLTVPNVGPLPAWLCTLKSFTKCATGDIGDIGTV